MQFFFQALSTLISPFDHSSLLSQERAGFALLAGLALLMMGTVPSTAQTTIYVDTEATGANDGTSWTDAYTNLQDALAAATSDDEIWIAEGVYTPDPDGTDRLQSFTITGDQDGLEIYGGFESGDAFEDRSPADHPVVLSGDIDGNDNNKTAAGVTPTANDIEGENSFHVLVLNGGTFIGDQVEANVTRATVIDGLIVTGGDASFDASIGAGAGLYCDGVGSGNECSPTVRNATFAGNTAVAGGAIYNFGTSSSMITEVTFSGNSASSQGGAIANDGSSGGASSPTITRAVFTNNDANKLGGAIFNNGRNGTSSPTITNATFVDNSANDGGGAICNNGRSGTSSPIIRNTVFSSNGATFGGAIFSVISSSSDPSITNATFAGNSAFEDGGAIFNSGRDGSSSTITNATFFGNSAKQGGAIYLSGSPTITNTILWGNTASDLFGENQVENDEGGSPKIAYSLIAGSGGSGSEWDSGLGTDKGGNIDADPQFADADGPDATAGTADDDLRLQGPGSPGGASPAIDAGDNEVISASEDLAGNERRLDVEEVDDTGNGTAPIVDMGAYESTGASLGEEVLSAPSSLSATATDAPSVDLSWSGVDDPDALQRYRLYRDTESISGSPSDLSPFDSTEAGTTTFTDEPEPGPTYSYRVTAVDTSGGESGFSAEASAFLYPSEVTASASRTFGGATDSTGYRLVALPGQADRPVGDAVSGEAGSQWQAYRDDGSGSDFLVKYDGSDTFDFQEGNGFWLTATSEWTFEETTPTVELRGDSATAIALREGWNGWGMTAIPPCSRMRASVSS